MQLRYLRSASLYSGLYNHSCTTHMQREHQSYVFVAAAQAGTFIV